MKANIGSDINIYRQTNNIEVAVDSFNGSKIYLISLQAGYLKNQISTLLNMGGQFSIRYIHYYFVRP